MPNTIKYINGPNIQVLKKGGFSIGTGDSNQQIYGFYPGIIPATNGYTIYQNTNCNQLSIYTASNDAQLIDYTNTIFTQSFTSVTQCFNWYNTQSDKMVFNKDYPAIITSGLVLNLDATFRPSYSTSGTTWYDLSPSGNNGTLTNGPTYSSSQGGSIVFDGTDDYVNVGMSNFPSGSSSRTLSAIFRVTSVSGGKELFGFGQNIGLGSRYALWIDGSNRIGIEFVGAAVTTSSWAGINNWIHLTAVLPSTNGFSTLIYVNGIQRSTTTGGSDGTINTPSAANGGVCYVGAVPGALVGFPHIFPGNVANVLVYNRALSSAEILQNFYGSNIVTSGLVLYLDAGNIVSYPQTGTVWYDISSGGNNGTLTNGPTFDSANSGSIVFDGTNDFVDFTSDSNLLPTDGLTVEAWFKTSVKDRFLVAKSSTAATNGYNLCGTSTDKIQLIVNSVSVNSVTNITNNVWTNCTATWIPSTSMTLYLNGSQNAINTTSIPAAIINPNSVIEICRRDGNRDYWNGNVSIVRIYNRALTAQEVSQNYNSQKSRFGL